MHDPTIERFLPGVEAESNITSGGVAWLRHGRGPMLVLFHGGAGSWNHWAANIPALGKHFTVVAIDGPGYGASSDTERDVTSDTYLNLVRAAIDEITQGANDIHLAGFSFGGFVASAMSAHLGERAAGLSLVGSAGFRKPGRRNLSLKSIRALRAELEREPTAEEVRALHAANLGQLMIWDPARIDAKAIDMQAANVDRTRFDSRPFSWSSGTPMFLAEATCPLQVIYGSHDTSVGDDLEYRIETCVEVVPDAEVEMLPDCGHWAMYEAPDLINELMIDFHADIAATV